MEKTGLECTVQTEKEYYTKLIDDVIKDYRTFGIVAGEGYFAKEYIFDEENDFVKFLDCLTETFGDCWDYKNILTKVFLNNLTSLDWSKVWLNINEQIYNNKNKFIFEYIMKFISLESLIKKINESACIELVYELYMLYGKVNKIPLEEMEQKYITYLDSAIKRKGSTYEQTFIYCFDNARNYNIFEHNLVNIACILLENINLNFVIKNGAKTIALKDKIALDSSIFHVSHKIINKFLSLNPGMYFKNSCYGVTSDICQLNFIVGNNDEGKKIFNSNDYQLYSLQQYNALKNSKYYDTKKYGQPIDNLAGIVTSAEKTILLELLYSDKIKMIGAEYLHIIKNKLGDEEYLRFMEHIKQNNILIYFVYEYEKVLVPDDYNIALNYLNMKNAERREKTLGPRRKR